MEQAARRAYIKSELGHSRARLKIFRLCQYLHLGKKVLGMEAWKDCVGECDVTVPGGEEAVDFKIVNWTNAELKLFGINMFKTPDDKRNWRMKHGNARYERDLANGLDEEVAAADGTNKKRLDGLKDRLKMARFRFCLCIAEAMQCRMREHYVRRRMWEMSKQ